MRQSSRYRLGLAGLATIASLALLAACGDNGSNSDISGGGGPVIGKLSLACPGSVAAGVKIVNGFSASLVAANGTPVTDTFVGISPTPNQGMVYAPAASSTATFGGNTDANGQLTFGFTAPASATQGTVYQLVAKLTSGTQTATCSVTVQTPSLVFTAPSGSSVNNTCTGVRLRVSSTASGDSSVKISNALDLTADNGAFFSSTATPSSCTASSGSSSLSQVPVSGSTGDFQNQIFLVSPSIGTSTVTATDDTNSARTASISVQFTTTVAQIVVGNSPSQVYTTTSTSPNGSATTTTLSATLYDTNGNTIANKPVTFTLTTPVSANTSGNKDQVYPSVSVTNKSGVATATYASGSTLDNGGASANAVVTVCAQDTNVCQTRSITVNK